MYIYINILHLTSANIIKTNGHIRYKPSKSAHLNSYIQVS